MSSHQAIRPLDDWLDSRLRSTVTEDLRYEASIYGPINALLGHVFPLGQRFMVKPQPKLRPLVLAEPGKERVSIDSMNNPMEDRKLGREKVHEPDFIVVKAGAVYGGDEPLVLVEVKRNGTPSAYDWDQMLRYMHSIKEKQKATSFRGYFVVGEKTYIYKMHADDGLDAVCTGAVATVDGLKAELESHAKAYW
jgi:hypothetical protein